MAFLTKPRLYEYLTSPESFFDATFLIFLIFGLFAWAFAVFWSLRYWISIAGDELAFYQLPLQERRAMDRQGLRLIVTGRPDLYQSFVKSWFAGGILLIIMIGLASLDLPARRRVVERYRPNRCVTTFNNRPVALFLRRNLAHQPCSLPRS